MNTSRFDNFSPSVKTFTDRQEPGNGVVFSFEVIGDEVTVTSTANHDGHICWVGLTCWTDDDTIGDVIEWANKTRLTKRDEK